MTDGALLSEADVFAGDPLRPDRETVTPAGVIATLTRPQREDRVRWLVDQAHAIVDDGMAAMLEGRDVAAVCVLYSGGNDSTVLTHIMRARVNAALHANTGIGIEETRQFVRDTCASWDLPLIEQHVGETTYRDIVLAQGFPGPPLHFKMYQRLKERALEAARRDLLLRPRHQRVFYLAGRRRAESARRAAVPLWEWKSKQSIAWISPIAMWTKADLNTYRLIHGIPVNPVSVSLGMSGECLCGAFAKPNELEEVASYYPETAAYIRELEAEVRAAGLIRPPFDTWGHGQGAPSDSGPLCSSCESRNETLPFDVAPTTAVQDTMTRIRARREGTP